MLALIFFLIFTWCHVLCGEHLRSCVARCQGDHFVKYIAEKQLSLNALKPFASLLLQGISAIPLPSPVRCFGNINRDLIVSRYVTLRDRSVLCSRSHTSDTAPRFKYSIMHTVASDHGRARPGEPRRTDLWPPANVDPSALWVEGKSSGPLGRSADALFERKFVAALEIETGHRSEEIGFARAADLAKTLVTNNRDAQEIAGASQRVLRSLFPDWPPFAPLGRVGLLYWFEVLFAKPFPAFSAKLNAWVTYLCGHWLMGPCTLEDIDDIELARAPLGAASVLVAGDGKGQQMLVKRCRFLEETKCASICVNACKMPTQNLFNEDMGVPMRMLPDYDTLECRFQFGVVPSEVDEMYARSTPCFAACPSSGKLRDLILRCPSMSTETQTDDRQSSML